MSEFDLIARYFAQPARAHPGAHTLLGPGDDCALLRLPPGEVLAISSDMLVEDRHFFAGADPFMLGHKALAVNLSDLAAMGARPLGFTLALALPAADEAWLAAFSAGLLRLAREADCALIGGDTTRGPLNICITVFGSLPPQAALRRDGAKAGDQVWVSGSLGEARLGLAWLSGEALPDADPAWREAACARLHLPAPRLALGQALRGVASAALDISDGLAGDLGHILQASGVAAQLHAEALPAGPALASCDAARRLEYMLSGGDDYELCFCAPPAQQARVRQIGRELDLALHCIGEIVPGRGLQVLDPQGLPLSLQLNSFDHFRTS
ncbi:thiamine-phosphate kinase [Massilia sp. W12]|uniref:thiamine-phosphate kinase n=1 Tax=Massilia sp. W12 TaxID=3126507 RepID=UPI0030CC1330